MRFLFMPEFFPGWTPFVPSQPQTPSLKVPLTQNEVLLSAFFGSVASYLVLVALLFAQALVIGITFESFIPQLLGSALSCFLLYLSVHVFMGARNLRFGERYLITLTLLVALGGFCAAVLHWWGLMSFPISRYWETAYAGTAGRVLAFAYTLLFSILYGALGAQACREVAIRCIRLRRYGHLRQPTLEDLKKFRDSLKASDTDSA